MKVLVTGGSGFIGTNLTQYFEQNGIDFCNLDVVFPKDATLAKNWIKCNILDVDMLEKEFARLQPSAVVHLAAETDTDPSKTMADYRANTEGTSNLLRAINASSSVDRVIITSTQYVNQSGLEPQHDQDYAPHTIYGESKIISEQYTRQAELKATWTIIRPTNIWGPWHLRYPFEFWKVLAEGKYVHPGKQVVVRSYGYVGNVVHQISRILDLPKESVSEKVYYVGDEPIDLYQWVNGFSLKQTGKKVTRVPRALVYSLAVFGDIAKKLGVEFPITTSRYKSMTTDNPASMSRTFEELGPARYTLQEGIDQTVRWLSKQHPELVKTSLK